MRAGLFHCTKQQLWLSSSRARVDVCYLFASNGATGYEFFFNDTGSGGLLLSKGVVGILGWPIWLQLRRV